MVAACLVVGSLGAVSALYGRGSDDVDVLKLRNRTFGSNLLQQGQSFLFSVPPSGPPNCWSSVVFFLGSSSSEYSFFVTF
uniref:Putative secreted protein n=1 Tax=Panstrongylus lignarius TaxID=156445 RepID=A0A224XSX1_9HEMI